MNWHRGLWRVWIVLSIGWLSFWAWRLTTDCNIGGNDAGFVTACAIHGAHVEVSHWIRVYQISDEVFSGIGVLIAVPFIVLLATYVAVWLTRGFRSR